MSLQTISAEKQRLPDGARQAMDSLIKGFSVLQADAPEDAVISRRRLALEQFQANGFPDHRTEEWRYTDLIGTLDGPVPPLDPTGKTQQSRQLDKVYRLGCSHLEGDIGARVVFVNGRFDRSLSELSGFPEGIVLKTGDAHPVMDGAQKVTEVPSPGNMLESLNLSLARDGFSLTCLPGAHCEGVVHFLFLNTQSTPCSMHLRTRIKLGAGARLQLLESHIGAGNAACLQTHMTDCILEPESRFEHVCIDKHGVADIFLARFHAELQEQARLSCGVLGAGGRLSRREYAFSFSNPGAQAKLSALSLAHGGELRDINARMNHYVGECSSDTLVKSVLTENAHGVFQGLVKVDPGAAKSNGQQVSKALLLGQGASMNAKPELEIFNDDVECSHGSAIGELDEEALFYLCSRGIDFAEARRMLIAAFLVDVFSRIENSGLASTLKCQAKAWLDEWQSQ